MNYVHMSNSRRLLSTATLAVDNRLRLLDMWHPNLDQKMIQAIKLEY